MHRILFAAVAVGGLIASSAAFAGPVAGAAAGAATGAVVAGPPGAVVGGVAGAVIGDHKKHPLARHHVRRRHHTEHTDSDDHPAPQ
jgi:uncharacterized protein YcfJ